MVVVITGATSKIGSLFLEELIKSSWAKANIKELYCLTRTPENWSPPLNRESFPIVPLKGDLARGAIDFPPTDLCIHLAALTHSNSESEYLNVNFKSTLELARVLRSKGCEKFYFVSSQTSGHGAGAYARSKFLAEQGLIALNFKWLRILRPSEVVDVGGSEGIDKVLNLAKNFRAAPLFVGLRPIIFSPLSGKILVENMVNDLKTELPAVRVQTIHGKSFTSFELSKWLWTKYYAIPIPIFLPLLAVLAKLASTFGVHFFAKDQVERLTGIRGQVPVPSVKVEDREVPYNFLS